MEINTSREMKLKGVAGTTGLEPATSDVTGRRSNQLNYVPFVNDVGRNKINIALALLIYMGAEVGSSEAQLGSHADVGRSNGFDAAESSFA